MSEEKATINWAAVGAIAGVLALFIAILAWQLPRSPDSKTPAAPAQDSSPSPSPSTAMSTPVAPPTSAVDAGAAGSSAQQPVVPQRVAPQKIEVVLLETSSVGTQPIRPGVFEANQNNGTQFEYRYTWKTITNFGPLDTQKDCSVSAVLSDATTGQLIDKRVSNSCSSDGWGHVVMPTGQFSLLLTVELPNGSRGTATGDLTVVA